MRTRISSRILKPRGRRQSRSTASRRTRKHPLIGSLTCHRLVGKSSIAARVEMRDSAVRSAAERSLVAAVAEAARDHDVGCCTLGLEVHVLEHLRRVLEVSIHDADVWCASRPHPRDHSASQPSDALRSLPVDQIHGTRGLDPPDRVGGVVIAVVDEDDLNRQIGEDTIESRHERADVVGFRAGGNDHRDRGSRGVAVQPGDRCRHRDATRMWNDSVLARPRGTEPECVPQARLTRCVAGPAWVTTVTPRATRLPCRIHNHLPCLHP